MITESPQSPGEAMSALAALVEAHADLLYRYAFRLCGSAVDAEDLTQQAFLAAHNHLDQLRDPDRAKPWLCTILRNVYLKQFRNSLPCCSLDGVAEPAAECQVDSPVDQEQLQAALLELPEEYRSPVVLFYFEDLSYKEIAEQLGVPIGTVMSRLARGKAFLKTRLSQEFSERD